MRIVLALIQRVGGWHPGLHLKIDNAPYMDLVIEALEVPGPMGLPALSVAHYGQLLDGNPMRCPEVYFELDVVSRTHLSAFYYCNDYLAIEQWSRFIRDGRYEFLPRLHSEHERCVALWDWNLNTQGFLDVFDPRRHLRA